MGETLTIRTSASNDVIKVVERGPQGPTGPQGPAGEGGASTWNDITGKPSTFAPSAHASTHATGGSDPLTPANIGAAKDFTEIEVGNSGTSTTTLTTAQLPARVILFIDAATAPSATINLPTPDARQSGLVASIKVQVEGGTADTALITVVHSAVNLLSAYSLAEDEGSIDFRWDGYRWVYDANWLLRSSTGRVLELPTTSGTLALTENADSTFRIVGSADATKKVAFEVDGLTTATTRTLTVPDASGTIARTEDFASPPAIGNTTRNTVAATTMSATGAITGAVAGNANATSTCNGFQIPVPAAGGSSAVGMYGAFTAGSQRAVIFGANTTGSTSTIADFSASGLVASSIQNTPIGSTTPSTGAFTTLNATVNGLATTPTQGLTLRNSTAAANGAQQVSPFLSLAGQGWDSGTNSSREVEFGWHVIPVQANPVISELVLRHRVAGGAWTNVASFFSGNNTSNTTVFTLNGAFGATTFRRGGNNDIGIDQGLRVGGGYIRLDAGGGNIAFLQTDANDVFAQRNGTAAQEYRLYGTFTTATTYQRMTVKSVKQTLSALSGASATTTGTFIPDGAVVVGVTTRVATALTGATGYQVGDGTDADRWGDIGFTALNTTSDNRDWTAGTIECFTAGGNITLTAKTSNFTAGAIEICVFYLAGEAD